MKTFIKNLFLLPALIVGVHLMLTGRVTAQTVTNLHSFIGSDGASPVGGLILSSNTLYGTASAGGSSIYGTVFRLNTDGSSFTNLHSFTYSNGVDPEASLILSGNILYGTTHQGGSSYGAVFAVHTDGTGFTDLHVFTGGSDGSSPEGGLILSGTTLYGTAEYGGRWGWGNVFAVNINGTGFTNLYSFTGGNDGAVPAASLILSGTTLYGTTLYGGNDGVVFAVNINGTGFTILHTFTGYINSTNSDGYYPGAALMLSGTTLYGTASHGGGANKGTVFKVSTNGTGFAVLHSFTALTNAANGDGADPEAGLMLLGSTLYGTTVAGGSLTNGTVFAVNTDGTGFTNLHSFTGGSDGACSYAGLISSDSNLYGTAYHGGSAGYGTVFSLTLPGLGFFIVPTFDSSITNDPNGPAMMAAINAAAQVFHTNISDNFKVYIHYTNDPTVGLGQSVTWANNASYANYLAALKNSAAGVNDLKAISQLPNSATDPVIGSSQIRLTLALARHMGLALGEGPDGFDSTISLNMALMNFTRPPGDTNKYDLQAVIEHENDEVLGTSSRLSKTSPIKAADLFRYTTNLDRTFTTNYYYVEDDDAYFSVDGTNLWARYNMDPRGDYGDWWSASGTNRWAPPGTPPHPQVQDAFGSPGGYEDLGANELAMLDAVGWTLAGNVALPPLPAPNGPAVVFSHNGAAQLTLSWPTNVSGYVLQESTSLTPDSWVTSASGATNPAIILPTATHKFFRIYNAPTFSVAQPNAAAVQPSTNTSLELETHVFLPRQP